jgi:hypothetical protein
MSTSSGPWGATPNTAADLFQIGLQRTSSFGQAITTSAGAYTLSWSDAGRNGYFDETYQVSFGGNVLGTASVVAGQAWGTHSISFASAGGSQLLQFQGLTNDADATAFIDNVSLTTAVPEPSTWALMFAGVATLFFVNRKRNRR